MDRARARLHGNDLLNRAKLGPVDRGRIDIVPERVSGSDSYAVMGGRGASIKMNNKSLFDIASVAKID